MHVELVPPAVGLIKERLRQVISDVDFRTVKNLSRGNTDIVRPLRDLGIVKVSFVFIIIIFFY